MVDPEYIPKWMRDGMLYGHPIGDYRLLLDTLRRWFDTDSPREIAERADARLRFTPPAAGMKRGWLRRGRHDPDWIAGVLYNDQNRDTGCPLTAEIEYRIIETPPTPARCVCGAEAEITAYPGNVAIDCVGRCGWGLVKSTRAEAIEAWNAMMERAK